MALDRASELLKCWALSRDRASYRVMLSYLIISFQGYAFHCEVIKRVHIKYLSFDNILSPVAENGFGSTLAIPVTPSNLPLLPWVLRTPLPNPHNNPVNFPVLTALPCLLPSPCALYASSRCRLLRTSRHSSSYA